MENDSARRRFPLSDRLIEVIDDTLTGEVLLDEALKLMKSSEKMSVSSWIDLMSGMTTPEIYPKFSNTYFRRDMEPHEDRIPTKTSSRTSG